MNLMLKTILFYFINLLWIILIIYLILYLIIDCNYILYILIINLFCYNKKII